MSEPGTAETVARHSRAGRDDESAVDVLVPTCGRPEALAVTLAGLANQTVVGFRVVVSDQTPDRPAVDQPVVRAMVRQLRRQGSEVVLHRGRPRRGMAEQRQFLLDQSASDFVLCLDDDVFLEARTLARMLSAIRTLGCGFVGSAPQGLSYLDDVRPGEQAPFEVASAPVEPERIRKGDPGWDRWTLHNAANLVHLGSRTPVPTGGWVPYKVAWVAGCVLFDRAELTAAGGFEFCRQLPPGHRGEDVVAQLRVMERAGGVGLLPSGAVHLELPTAVVDRTVDAYAEIVEEGSRNNGRQPS